MLGTGFQISLVNKHQWSTGRHVLIATELRIGASGRTSTRRRAGLARWDYNNDGKVLRGLRIDFIWRNTTTPHMALPK